MRRTPLTTTPRRSPARTPPCEVYDSSQSGEQRRCAKRRPHCPVLLCPPLRSRPSMSSPAISVNPDKPPHTHTDRQTGRQTRSSQYSALAFGGNNSQSTALRAYKLFSAEHFWSAENAGPENAGPENEGPNITTWKCIFGYFIFVGIPFSGPAFSVHPFFHIRSNQTE